MDLILNGFIFYLINFKTCEMPCLLSALCCQSVARMSRVFSSGGSLCAPMLVSGGWLVL